MYIVGLTGGLASGKSTVAKFFAALGVPVIDADAIAREVVAPGSPALAAIVDRFGPQVLRADGTLNRAELRERVFHDPAQRSALEAILHPRILKDMQRRAAQLEAPYCLFMIPLLVESGQTRQVDRVLVVDAPLALQRRRAQERDGLSPQTIDAILAAQAQRSTRLAAADDVLRNDADLDALRAGVAALHTRYLALAAQHG